MNQKLKKKIIFETTFEKYTASSIVGEGGVGCVYQVVDDAGNEWAIKLLDASKSSTEKKKRFQNEINFCQRIDHPNIVSVKDHGIHDVEGVNAPFYVMPIYPKSLRRLMDEKIHPRNVLDYFTQLLNGVEAAHFRKVTHRDLKPENILYDEINKKLLVADFGVADFSAEDMATLVETKPGTRLANFRYAAPEQRQPNGNVSYHSDIFTLGLILNEMFTGEVPQGIDFKTIHSVDAQYGYLDEIVSSMLKQSPADRPSTIDVIKQRLIALKNDFVSRQKVSELDARKIVNVDEGDDRLIADPIRLVNFDWNSGNLELHLSQSVNDRWKHTFLTMNNYAGHTSVMGKGPETFHLQGNKAYIGASDSEVQRIIEYFKQWLPMVNARYKQTIELEKRGPKGHCESIFKTKERMRNEDKTFSKT